MQNSRFHGSPQSQLQNPNSRQSGDKRSDAHTHRYSLPPVHAMLRAVRHLSSESIPPLPPVVVVVASAKFGSWPGLWTDFVSEETGSGVPNKRNSVYLHWYNFVESTISPGACPFYIEVLNLGRPVIGWRSPRNMGRTHPRRHPKSGASSPNGTDDPRLTHGRLAFPAQVVPCLADDARIASRCRGNAMQARCGPYDLPG